jgi:hypothetical protein
MPLISGSCSGTLGAVVPSKSMPITSAKQIFYNLNIFINRDPVNGSKYGITDFNSIQWLMIDESYVAGYFINILESVRRNSYLVSFWSCFLFSAHLDLASIKLTVGASSDFDIHSLKAFKLIRAPGNAGESKLASSTILI